jgi:hypothetical protein
MQEKFWGCGGKVVDWLRREGCAEGERGEGWLNLLVLVCNGG